jgi:hypothetical protein
MKEREKAWEGEVMPRRGKEDPGKGSHGRKEFLFRSHYIQ